MPSNTCCQYMSTTRGGTKNQTASSLTSGGCHFVLSLELGLGGRRWWRARWRQGYRRGTLPGVVRDTGAGYCKGVACGVLGFGVGARACCSCVGRFSRIPSTLLHCQTSLAWQTGQGQTRPPRALTPVSPLHHPHNIEPATGRWRLPLPVARLFARSHRSLS